jgi:hydrophobe/amphiphile efflux-3 (HAE3) family protein
MKELESLGVWIARNPFLIILAVLLMTFMSFSYAQNIRMEGMTTEGFVGKESPLYQIYDHLFVQRFGTESIVVLMEGDDVTSPQVLNAMLRFSLQMKEVPDVIRVNSIGEYVAEVENATEGERIIPSKERVDEILLGMNPGMKKGMLPDKHHTTIGVEIPLTVSEEERARLLSEIESAARIASFPPGSEYTITGSPVLSASIMDEMSKSNVTLLGLSAILMIIVLFFVFRHVKWPLLPLPIVLFGIIWTFGAMGFLDIPMTMVSMSAFPVLIGIGIDYAIQFHNRIDEEFRSGKDPLTAVVNTVVHVSQPVMIALIITAAGFVSLFSSTVPMIREFGLLCLIGLFMCYLSALFVGVTVLSLAERRAHRNKKDAQPSVSSASNEPEGKGGKDLAGASCEDGSSKPSEGTSDTLISTVLVMVAKFCVKRWKIVLALALLLCIAGTWADTKVLVETDFKNYLPSDLPPLVDFNHMSEIFGGTDEINLLVQADDLTEPDTMKWMNDFGEYLIRSRAQVQGITSIATFVKDAAGGAIPTDQTEIRQVIDNLPSSQTEKFIDGRDTAVVNVNIGRAISDLGAEGTDRLVKEVDKDIVWMPPPPGVEVRQTGDAVVMTTVIAALTTGRTEMTLLGLILIFIILLLIYRDLIKALLPVLPMMVVIGWMGGVMYLFEMKYSPLTATLGALILGVGSEYAILMMERFYEELEKADEPMDALKVAVSKIGSALIASGLTTVGGFAALIASPFLITNNFGIVTVMAIVFALLTTFTVFVVLMILFETYRKSVNRIKDKIKNSSSNVNRRTSS